MVLVAASIPSHRNQQGDDQRPSQFLMVRICHDTMRDTQRGLVKIKARAMNAFFAWRVPAEIFRSLRPAANAGKCPGGSLKPAGLGDG
jgi:hypothetical protein